MSESTPKSLAIIDEVVGTGAEPSVPDVDPVAAPSVDTAPERPIDVSRLFPEFEAFPPDDVPLAERAKIVEDQHRRGVLNMKEFVDWQRRLVGRGEAVSLDEDAEYDEPKDAMSA